MHHSQAPCLVLQAVFDFRCRKYEFINDSWFLPKNKGEEQCFYSHDSDYDSSSFFMPMSYAPDPEPYSPPPPPPQTLAREFLGRSDFLHIVQGGEISRR